MKVIHKLLNFLCYEHKALHIFHTQSIFVNPFISFFCVIFNFRFNKKKNKQPTIRKSAVDIKYKHQLDMQYFAVVMILANINYGMYKLFDICFHDVIELKLICTYQIA